jgi:hypothetical protein
MRASEAAHKTEVTDCYRFSGTYARLIQELLEHENRALSIIGQRMSKELARLRAKLGL